MRLKLLIVEDEPDARQLLDYNFTAAGFDVITAGSGGEGLQLALRHKPDIIVLDILLPDTDGFTVCRRLRLCPLTASMPIVLLSSHSGFSVQAAGIEAGARRSLSKVTDLSKIIEAVRLTWEESNDLSSLKM